MNTLDSIGIKYKTDKASTDHNYLVFYETFLGTCDREFKKIVEVGAAEGQSLKMWREAYQSADVIIGIDCDPDRYSMEHGERIRVFEGHQSSPPTFAMHVSECDLFIDDGSHIWSDQLKTFIVIWPLLPVGAVYIAEDLHTSFPDHWPSYDNAGTCPYWFMQEFCLRNNARFMVYVGEGRNSITMAMQKMTVGVDHIDSVNFDPKTSVINPCRIL